MNTRRVFSTTDMAVARNAIAAARHAGVPDEDLYLVAKSGIEMERIPEHRKDVTTDFIPAALRGAGAGGAIGLVAGLIAVTIPAVGITVAGAGLITLIGAAVGGWSYALAGSAVPNPVRRRFEEEIEAGRILVVVDDEQERAPAVDRAIIATGAVQMPFEEPSEPSALT
ncbi:MAG: hypothetical protein J0H15_14405 [Xanthomonadales bacterium]|nr:hypothetical protein [Xanthomonadales bacterium]